jgi:hypothetical protein
MILDGGFATPGDDDDVFDARRDGFLDAVLLVAGRKRVPRPAAGKTALRTRGFMDL